MAYWLFLPFVYALQVLRRPEQRLTDADVLCCKVCEVPIEFVTPVSEELTWCPQCKQINASTKYLTFEQVEKDR